MNISTSETMPSIMTVVALPEVWPQLRRAVAVGRLAVAGLLARLRYGCWPYGGWP